MKRLQVHVDKHGTLDAARQGHACVITAGNDLDLVDTTTGCVIYSPPFTPRGLERLAAYARVHHVWLVPDAPRAAFLLNEGMRHAEVTQTCAVIDAALAREALEECKNQ